MLWVNVVGDCFGRILWANVVGECCGRMLWANVVCVVVVVVRGGVGLGVTLCLMRLA